MNFPLPCISGVLSAGFSPLVRSVSQIKDPIGLVPVVIRQCLDLAILTILISGEHTCFLSGCVTSRPA
jgi:hypothetical protein